MSKIKMDLSKELESRGIYAIEGTWYGGYPYNEVERLTPPITPRENILRYYRGEDYEWVPDISSDQIEFTPDCIPDVVACGFSGGLDNFGVKWIPVGDGTELPSFVEPGFVLLEDIADWEKLEWPDVESWPWKETAARFNETYKDDDRLRRGVLLSAYFERLISVMGFEGAAMAMVEDPESVEAYFDKLTELNIQTMKHYIEDFHCDAIKIHDDWSAQRSPFFSLSVAQELLAPQVKKLVDYAHERGVIFTLHSCGNGKMLIPAMKEAGIDAWQAQSDALEIEECYELCGDDLMIETDVMIPSDLNGEALEAFIRGIFEKACVKHRATVLLSDWDPERNRVLRKVIYKVGREMAVAGITK